MGIRDWLISLHTEKLKHHKLYHTPTGLILLNVEQHQQLLSQDMDVSIFHGFDTIKWNKKSLQTTLQSLLNIVNEAKDNRDLVNLISYKHKEMLGYEYFLHFVYRTDPDFAQFCFGEDGFIIFHEARLSSFHVSRKN